MKCRSVCGAAARFALVFTIQHTAAAARYDKHDFMGTWIQYFCDGETADGQRYVAGKYRRAAWLRSVARGNICAGKIVRRHSCHVEPYFPVQVRSSCKTGGTREPDLFTGFDQFAFFHRE